MRVQVYLFLCLYFLDTLCHYFSFVNKLKKYMIHSMGVCLLHFELLISTPILGQEITFSNTPKQAYLVILGTVPFPNSRNVKCFISSVLKVKRTSVLWGEGRGRVPSGTLFINDTCISHKLSHKHFRTFEVILISW